MRMSTETKTDRVLVLLCLYTLAISTFLLASSWLGAQWLRIGFAGLPVGVWLAVIGGVSVGWYASGAPILRRHREPGVSRLTGILDQLEIRARSRRGGAKMNASDPAAYDPRSRRRLLAGLAPQRAGGAAGILADFALSSVPNRPIRLGCTGIADLDSPRDWPGGFDCEVVAVEPAADESADQIMHRHRLDAWIHVEPSDMEGDLDQPYLIQDVAPQGPIAHILTPERTGKPAAAFDVGRPLPVGLSDAFPLRLDSGETILRNVDADCTSQREALLDLAFAQAALSRANYRLTLGDLFQGRHAWPSSDVSRVVGTLLHHQGKAPVHQACARLVAAWFGQSGHADARGPWVHGVLEATGRLRTEATALLQRGAAFAADRRYDESIRAFIDAALRIQAEELQGTPANAAFFQFNLEPHRRHDPAAIGLLAAGVAVMLATCERELRRYVRQDIEEDLAQAQWIVDDGDAERFLLRLVERIVQLPQTTKGTPLVPAA